MYGGLTLLAFFTRNLNIPKVCKQKLGFQKNRISLKPSMPFPLINKRLIFPVACQSTEGSHYLSTVQLAGTGGDCSSCLSNALKVYKQRISTG